MAAVRPVLDAATREELLACEAGRRGFNRQTADIEWAQ
jgi:hypothetical protein